MRSPSPASRERSSHPIASPGLAVLEVGDNRLSGRGRLPFRRQRSHARGQVDVDPRAEPDHADALPGGDGRALLYEGHDAARHQAGDLDHPDLDTSRSRDDEAVALVVLARLVEIRIDESPGAVRHALDAAG